MTHRQPLSALTLFRSGMDTADIAKHLKITEAAAHEQLSRERSAELGLGDPYDRSEKPVTERLRPYAGHPSSRVSGV